MSPRKPAAPTLDELGPLTELPRFRLSLVREPDEPAYQPRLCTEAADCSHPDAAARFLLARVQDEPNELLGALYLDTRNRVIGWAVLYRGTLNRASVEPRAVLQLGLLLNAAAALVFHNHPSGDPSPSAEDLAFTRRLAEAGEIVGIRLVDHLILGCPDRWISLAQRGGW